MLDLISSYYSTLPSVTQVAETITSQSLHVLDSIKTVAVSCLPNQILCYQEMRYCSDSVDQMNDLSTIISKRERDAFIKMANSGELQRRLDRNAEKHEANLFSSKSIVNESLEKVYRLVSFAKVGEAIVIMSIYIGAIARNKGGRYSMQFCKDFNNNFYLDTNQKEMVRKQLLMGFNNPYLANKLDKYKSDIECLAASTNNQRALFLSLRKILFIRDIR